MTVQRLENVGIVVDDLAAVTAFFVELGLELLVEGMLQGDWVDHVVGLEGVRTEIAMLETSDAARVVSAGYCVASYVPAPKIDATGAAHAAIAGPTAPRTAPAPVAGVRTANENHDDSASLAEPSRTTAIGTSWRPLPGLAVHDP